MPDRRHLLLIGGGHAHVEVLRQFGEAPLPGWRVTLLTREAHSPYSGMLPGVIAGLYRPAQALIDITALAARCGVGLVLDRATGIDPAARRVRRADGADLAWDLLSIDTGATPDTSTPGAAEHALPLKPIDALLPRLQALADGRSVAVVGGGAAGFEVALALRRRAPVALVAGASGLLPGFPEALRQRAARALAQRGVTLVAGRNVAAVAPGALHFVDAPTLRAAALVWATGAAAAPWLAETGLSGTGLARDARGFLVVDECLRARPDIFAAGDVASFPGGLPKAGVFAVRQGPVLAANLRAVAAGQAPRPYVPQTDYLRLLSLGDGRALGTRNGLVFGGRWVWWLKDRIDRRFIARYQ
ncbi:FAD-dependent oxidoreductase [Falsiroseomonas selenitidurans]|uniref:FAD-dependent oxidoreductase n=1 Tax=Falsiroseomonas selenitidurans TaxID=2716335 RepID=A0ABX1DYZ2_9PROT|nr:FAD-dependent oxidoreductase [Falsiroseomonas selenitidurans]NKC30046.1 FAD-dependent oxidoreductase [Falsiroseomonas selenitidurans]